MRPTKYFWHGVARAVTDAAGFVGVATLLERLDLELYEWPGGLRWEGLVLFLALIIPTFWLTERIWPRRHPRDFWGRRLDGSRGGRYDADTWQGSR